MLRYWIRDKKQEFAAEGESGIWSVLGEKTIYVYSRGMWADVILLLNVLNSMKYDSIILYFVACSVLGNGILESSVNKKRNNMRYFCIILHVCKRLMQKRATT